MVNLTQHKATAEQVEAGVVDMIGEDHDRLVKNLTFDEIPTKDDMNSRAQHIINHLRQKYPGEHEVMIGGAPFFMSTLEDYLGKNGYKMYYAFSKRESSEIQQPDGTIKKIQVFKHLGFYQVP